MAIMKDFYYILGTDSNCTAAEIKDAYRKLSKKFHPDLNDGDKYFENRFREINEAYETLSNPAKRFQYDSNLKKLRSKRGAYQNTEPNNQSSNPFVNKPKSSGRFFTITVTVVLTIFGAYLIRSFSTSKKQVIKQTPDIITTPLKIRKHYKPKHTLRPKSEADFAKPRLDSAFIKPVKTVPVIARIKLKKNPDFLYATDVRANLTGIVNMRQTDDFDSDIIERIPANSKVLVLEKGDVYYRVFYNNHIGYVPKWSLDLK